MKVICDVCGTSIPETATHCPICGCAVVRPTQPTTENESQQSQGSSASNTYGNGGRFAKNNVRRNNHRGSEGRYSSSRERRDEPQGANKGLIAVVILLLLAIIAVVAYIGVNVLGNLNKLDSNPGGGQSVSTPEGSTGPQGDQTIACTDVKLGYKLHEFSQESDQLLLSIEKTPKNTTDAVTFTSSDPEIATVDENGLVKPGTKQGEVTITVTCGAMSDTCTIISTVGELPVESQPESQGPSIPDGFVLKLETYKNSGEITIGAEGATHLLYKEIMGVKASDITWTTSDPAVATVENGKVIGVDRGKATITATIGDQTATCLVRCPFDAAAPSPYELSIASATIAKGETFNLSLKDKETGANVQGVTWQASKDGVVEIDGNKITGGTVSKLTAVDVYTEYDGVTYTCKVYVKAPEA